MTKKRIIIAVTVVAAVVAAGLVGVKLVLPGFNNTRALCAEFTDAKGLYPGNKVQLLGIEVGAVTAITNKPDHVQVDFTVNKDIDLPADVGAVTYSQSIVADRHVELTKAYSSGPKFTGPHCIKLESTKTPIGASETFTAADNLINSLLGDGKDPAHSSGAQAINDTLRALSHSLDGTGPKLNQTLRDLVTMIGDPHQLDSGARQLIDNGEVLTSTLVAHWDSVATLLGSLPTTLTMIEGLADGFGMSLHYLAHALPILVDALNRFAPTVYNNITDKLVPFVKDILNAYTPNIIGTINALPPVTDWLATQYQPFWGTRDVTYLPPTVAVSPSQNSAICSVLQERNTPGSQAACAPGTASDPVTLGLTDLILGGALR
jgi:phospholipid/cholesterol/gamma-HCH transport system substrate-binding protein